MVGRHILIAAGIAIALCSVAPGAASEPRRRPLRFPAAKASVYGGIGSGRIAFYVCADDVDLGVAFAKPKLAASACKRGAKRALPVYGPYRYPASRKDDWAWLSDYPYERLDGQHYSRGGYQPTP